MAGLAASVAVVSCSPGEALATVGHCTTLGDAPPGFQGVNSCTGPGGAVCQESGAELTCDLRRLCGSGDATNAKLVTGYTVDHDVSAWGSCFPSAVSFCCVFDDTAGIDTVTLIGTEQGDEGLFFSHDIGLATARNLEPWDDDPIEGFIRGLGGGDLIYGSDSPDPDYGETLLGHNGNDSIRGLQGKDFLSGGNHDDKLYGDAGNDKLWGGDGNDELWGAAGNDALCDSSGYQVCALDGGNFMDGGGGGDQLWFNETEGTGCGGIRLDHKTNDGDPRSAAGIEPGDTCGDSDNWFVSEGPIECDAYTTVVPARCDGAG